MQAAAARNNAEWCDIVCRSHGAHPEFEDDAWSSPSRTPPFYPDAVTLQPNPSVSELLARVDAAVGCSIKDSFRTLDLSGHGFRPLFDATWIVRTSKPLPTAPTDLAWDLVWDVVRTPEDLEAWEAAWRGDDGAGATFPPGLLDADAVSVLVARTGDRIVAGAILNRSATVVGITNFFFATPDRAAAVSSASWCGCIAYADSMYPGATFVGYESGDALAVALRAGFEAIGPLRVWINDA